MIVEDLYKQVKVLDRTADAGLRVKHPFSDFTPTAHMNSVFVAAVEFADICRDYPIVFVRAGKEPGTNLDNFAPMAVLGMVQNENLFLQQPGGAWRVPYIPAFLRRYPFGMVSIADGQSAICIDRAWEGFSETEGDPLFGADGEPTELMKQTQTFVQSFEEEVQRTRSFCALLRDDGLLYDMRFEATTQEGEKFSVDGFCIIDEKKLAALPDDKVLQYVRNGVLGLIHAQQLSMPLMRKLADWHVQRIATKQ